MLRVCSRNRTLLQAISQVAGRYASLHADAYKPFADRTGTPMGIARKTGEWSAQTHPRAGRGDILDNHRWGRASQTNLDGLKAGSASKNQRAGYPNHRASRFGTTVYMCMRA